MRLGFVTWADIDDALAAKAGRLCSTLVRRGKLSADEASRALAEQHGVPAALSKHLHGRDVALAPELPAALARELCALPVAISRGNGSLVVCVRDPDARTTAALTEALRRPVTMAVCVECALAPLVAEAYPMETAIELDDLADEVPVEAVPAEVEVDVNSGAFNVTELQLVSLDDLGVAKTEEVKAGPRRMSGPFAVITEAGLELPAPVSTPPPGLKAATAAAAKPPARLDPKKLSRDAAVVAITGASTRDAVVDAVVAFLRHRYTAGVVFAVKDGLALGHGGFGGDLDADSLTALVIPMSQPSVLRGAHDHRESYLGPPTSETSVVQDRFFKLIGKPPSAVAVLPVVINGRVVNIVYAHGPRDGDDAKAVAELQTVLKAVEEAFVRVIRETKA